MNERVSIRLLPLEDSDREQFILDNQEAFNYGALQENGHLSHQFEEEGQIISRATIEQSIDEGQAYRIQEGNQVVGGLVVKVEGECGDLDLLFISPGVHSRGLGYAAWCEVERLYPQVVIWQTVTPYFEQRNIHFYVNRCGFHIVEFFNPYHPDPNEPKEEKISSEHGFQDAMFRFEKRIKKDKV